MTKTTIKFTKKNLQRLRSSSESKWYYAKNFKVHSLIVDKKKKLSFIEPRHYCVFG